VCERVNVRRALRGDGDAVAGRRVSGWFVNTLSGVLGVSTWGVPTLIGGGGGGGGEGWSCAGSSGICNSGLRDDEFETKHRAVGHIIGVPLSSPCLFCTASHAMIYWGSLGSGRGCGARERVKWVVREAVGPE
jgi:hypothetical protein